MNNSQQVNNHPLTKFATQLKLEKMPLCFFVLCLFCVGCVGVDVLVNSTEYDVIVSYIYPGHNTETYYLNHRRCPATSAGNLNLYIFVFKFSIQMASLRVMTVVTLWL